MPKRSGKQAGAGLVGEKFMTGNARAKAAYQETQAETSLYAGNAEEATLVVLSELLKSMRLFAETPTRAAKSQKFARIISRAP